MGDMRLTPPDISDAGSASDADVDEFQCARNKMSFKEEFWFYCVRVGFLLLSSFLSLAVVIVYMWHVIGPESLRWLCDSDLSRLKDLAITIIVGLLMSTTTTYFFKRNGNGK